MAPVLGMNANPLADDAEAEQHVVGDAEAVEDDVPAVGAHDHARQQRRERQRDQQALPAALRPHEEIGERISQHDVDQRRPRLRRRTCARRPRGRAAA